MNKEEALKSGNIEVIPVRGLPLIREGDLLPTLISKDYLLEDGDIVAIATTVYSKSKGFVKRLDSVTPSARALKIAASTGEDPRFIEIVLGESEEVLLEVPFVLSLLPFGHIGVRAGVDQSNVDSEYVIILPKNPMESADELRNSFKEKTGHNVGVILTDTCGRSFRRGQTGHAIGWSGIDAIRDFRGDHDLFGHELKITEEAVVDEISGFANFVMGESNNGVPAVIFRNCHAWTGHDDLYFRKDEDLMRKALNGVSYEKDN